MALELPTSQFVVNPGKRWPRTICGVGGRGQAPNPVTCRTCWCTTWRKAFTAIDTRRLNCGTWLTARTRRQRGELQAVSKRTCRLWGQHLMSRRLRGMLYEVLRSIYEDCKTKSTCLHTNIASFWPISLKHGFKWSLGTNQLKVQISFVKEGIST